MGKNINLGKLVEEMLFSKTGLDEKLLEKVILNIRDSRRAELLSFLIDTCSSQPNISSRLLDIILDCCRAEDERKELLRVLDSNFRYPPSREKLTNTLHQLGFINEEDGNIVGWSTTNCVLSRSPYYTKSRNFWCSTTLLTLTGAKIDLNGLLGIDLGLDFNSFSEYLINLNQVCRVLLQESRHKITINYLNTLPTDGEWGIRCLRNGIPTRRR